MKWSDVGGMIAKVAPALGTLVAGPAGGAIGGAISIAAKALGVEETPEAIASVLKSDPEAYGKLKQAEMDNALALKQMLIDHAITQEQELTKRFQSANDADKSGHTTRPKIALMMAWILAIPYVGIGIAMTFAISGELVDVADIWPTLLAYLSIPTGLLKFYFGDLRKEHAQDRGQQVDFGMLGGLFGGKK